MYFNWAFPFDVVKTNRILNTNFSKECGENLPREMAALYERGQFRNGVFRGLVCNLGASGWPRRHHDHR